MEQVAENASFSSHIKKVLKSYRTASMTSLSGPDTFMVRAAAAAASGKGGATTIIMESTKHGSVIDVMEPKKLSGDVGGCAGGPIKGSSKHDVSYYDDHDAKKKLLKLASSVSDMASPQSPHISANTTVTMSAVVESVCSKKGGGATSVPMEVEGCGDSKGGSDYESFAPPFAIQQVPILTAPDQSRSERSETLIEDEVISCFLVGGEKRLCLPQILNSVLRDFSLQQINQVCDELQIFCSRCNHDQLQVLKLNSILPVTAPSCGLITKTDAERLCNALLHSHPPRAVHDVAPDKRPFHFTVYHECFGKCRGIYTPDYYSSALARCIECVECHGLFCPQKFVSHAHRALQNRTVHWGFDSNNWRYYILTAKDQETGAGAKGHGELELRAHLDEMKGRFDPAVVAAAAAAADTAGAGKSGKRKPHIESLEKASNGAKKLKFEENASTTYYPYVYDPMTTSYLYGVPTLARVSAFRPWSPVVGKDGKLALPTPPGSFGRDSSSQPLPPYLSHGPPVLLNPERVVSISEMERFERHYQPNVALAPPSAQMQALQKSAASADSPATFSNGERQDAVKSSHSNTVTGNAELELSTDTEEIYSDNTTCSSMESHGHQKMKSEAGTSCAEIKPTSFAKELKSLRDFISEEQIEKKTGAKLVEKVASIVNNCEQQLENSLLSKTQLLQELEYVRISKKERLREASETNHLLRKEVEKLYEEKVRREREMEELRKEASSLRHADRDNDCSSGNSEVKMANHHLRRKIDAMGEELQKLQDELTRLRRQQRAACASSQSQQQSSHSRSVDRGHGASLSSNSAATTHNNSTAVQKEVASPPVFITKIKKEKDFDATSFDE